jgi:hypothetical protein
VPRRPDALEDFVAGWHAGRRDARRVTHGAHVAVCAYYAFDHTPDETFALVKAGILDFARAWGIVHNRHQRLPRDADAPVDAGDCGGRVRKRRPQAAGKRPAPRSIASATIAICRGGATASTWWATVRARAEWVPPDGMVDGLLLDLGGGSALSPRRASAGALGGLRRHHRHRRGDPPLARSRLLRALDRLDVLALVRVAGRLPGVERAGTAFSARSRSGRRRDVRGAVSSADLHRDRLAAFEAGGFAVLARSATQIGPPIATIRVRKV